MATLRVRGAKGIWDCGNKTLPEDVASVSPAAFLMLPLSTRLTPTLPLPVMPPTVTVYVAPLPATASDVLAIVPVLATWKSAASTLVTASLKVTAKSADVAFEAAAPIRLIDTTRAAVG